MLAAQVLTVLLSLLCSWLMAHQRIESFYVGTVGNFIYIAINFVLGAYVVILSYVVFTGMNIYAIHTWKKMRKNARCHCVNCGVPMNTYGEPVSDHVG